LMNRRRPKPCGGTNDSARHGGCCSGAGSLAALLSRCDFMREFLVFSILAAARGRSAQSRERPNKTATVLVRTKRKRR
jgi:hypothetical protein